MNNTGVIALSNEKLFEPLSREIKTFANSLLSEEILNQITSKGIEQILIDGNRESTFKWELAIPYLPPYCQKGTEEFYITELEEIINSKR